MMQCRAMLGAPLLIPALARAETGFPSRALRLVVGAAMIIGRLRALAVTTAQRVPALPDMPTVAEGGFPGYESGSWQGIAVPVRTQAPVAETLRSALNAVLQDDGFRSRFGQIGMLVQPPRDAAATLAYVAADRARRARVIGERGPHLD